MTVLTQKQINEQFKVTNQEIDAYFKGHPKLPRTRANVRRIRAKLQAARIRSEPGKEISIKSSVGDRQIIYGRQRVGGTLTFVSNQSSNNGMLHIVITLAGHKIQDIENIYIDNEKIIFGASPDPRWSTGVQRLDGSISVADHKIFWSPMWGDVGQATNPDLNTQLPTLWTANHTQDGCAYVYMIFVQDATLFPDGLPDLTFDVVGKPLLRPDTGLYASAATSNPVAAIYDLLTDQTYGMKATADEFDTDQLQDEYDVCNEDITLATGGTEKRYTLNATFRSADSPHSILERMASAMGGTVTYVNGKWKVHPAKWRSAVLDLNEEDIVSDIRVQTKLSRRDSFNGVRGTFISPDHKWEETDFPAVKNDYYMSLDNGERVWEDIQLPCTISSATAQRLAKIELERNRQSITVQATFSLKAYQVEPPETVTLTIARFGWNQKAFEVQESTLVFDTSGGAPSIAVHMLLKETAQAVYDWNAGSETLMDLAPNSNLPNPLLTQPVSGLTLASGTNELYIRADGTVFSRIKVSWTALSDFLVTSGGHIEIQYKKSSDSSWQSATNATGDSTFTYILDVKDYNPLDPVTYDVRVRTVNSLRIPSSWTTITGYRVLGKTANPSNVTGFYSAIGSFGVRFTWDRSPDLDVNLYEIRVGATGTPWEQCDLVAQVSGTNYLANIQVSGSYQFLIKARDTSGNYSTEATSSLVVIPRPSPPVTITQFLGTDLLFKWIESTSNFAVAQYEIYYGVVTDDNPQPTFENAILLASVKGTTYVTKITWVGTRTFWVAARDVADNLGDPFQFSITITTPGVPVNLNGEVIDNNVLLRWSASTTGSLPIAKYRVYKGDLLSTATLVGEVGGTFASIFESVGSDAQGFTYWIIAVDSAGNVSQPATINLKVSEPPDFVLTTDGSADVRDATIATNIFIEGVGFLNSQGGPGGAGSSFGLLFLLTQSDTVPGGGGVGGSGAPIGLLLGITKN